MMLRMKNFNILGIHWKIRLLRGCSQKTNIEGWDSLKIEGGGFGQIVDLTGALARKSGVAILTGEVDTQCTLCSMFIYTFFTFFLNFYQQKSVFFFVIFFCDKISNIRKRILTIQKSQWVIRKCLWNCMCNSCVIMGSAGLWNLT